MDFARELEVALEAARRAARFILEEYQSFVAIPNAPASISTHVDRGSQDMILQYLRDHFPEDGSCAEEGTASIPVQGANVDRMWVVDPIDGTRGFAMKNGEFSVMIGLTIRQLPVVGVVLEPVSMRTTFATKGGGCWWCHGDDTPQRCQVTQQAEPAASTLVQSHTRKGAEPKGPVAAVQPAQVLEMYSAGVKMALVARGEADLYVNTYPNFSDWDICAGHILVEEAGGRVTGLRGEPLKYGGPGFTQSLGMLASNTAIHAEALRKLESVPLG